MIRAALSFAALALVTVACAGAPPDPPPGPPAIEAACTDQTAVPCIDQQESTLNMKPNDEAPGLVVDAKDGDHFHAKIDATAGGSAFTPTEGYVYAKFTKDGLVKVDLTDDAAFTSMDWDISFQRFIIRLNSGTGGPSCVTAARTKTGTTFDALNTVDASLEFHAEEYMEPSGCTLIPDGSGLGAPGVVLQNYWVYTGCLTMSHIVYVIERADGHHVKLEVTAYYGANQDTCETDGTATDATSANIELNWAFLD